MNLSEEIGDESEFESSEDHSERVESGGESFSDESYELDVDFRTDVHEGSPSRLQVVDEGPVREGAGLTRNEERGRGSS